MPLDSQGGQHFRASEEDIGRSSGGKELNRWSEYEKALGVVPVNDGEKHKMRQERQNSRMPQDTVGHGKSLRHVRTSGKLLEIKLSLNVFE